MQRRLPIARLGLILVLLLSACSVSTTPQGTAGSASPAASPAAASPAAGGESITIRWRTRPSDAAEQAVYQQLADTANQTLAAKNIRIQYEPGVNQGYFEKLKTEIAAGNEPDIYWIGAVELADFVATGKVLDLKPYIDKDGSFTLDSFVQQPIAELNRDGKVYGLPRDISTMVVYYNADLFKAAGLPTPQELAAQGRWNWESFLDTARKLTDPARQQYGVGFGNWWGPAWGYFTYAAGGGIFNQDRTACALDQPASIEGARFAKQLYDEKLLPPSDAESENLFNAGKIGMYFNGRWFTPGVRQNATFAWDVAEMPQGQRNMTWLFWGPYLVSANSRHPDAAWEALKEITSAEAMARVAELGTNIPARTDERAVQAFLKSTPPANNQAFLDGIAYAQPEAPVWNGSWADFSSTVQQLWDQMIAGQLTPEQFGQQACQQGASALGQ